MVGDRAVSDGWRDNRGCEKLVAVSALDFGVCLVNGVSVVFRGFDITV